MKGQRRRWPYSVLGVVAVALFLFPVYWLFSTSLKTPGQLFARPPTWIPTSLDLANYGTVLSNPQMTRTLVNSVEISVGVTALTLILAAPAAYALARLKLRWSGVFLLPFLIAQLLPTINIALPMYLLFSNVHLTDSIVGLMLGDTVLPAASVVVSSVPKPFNRAARRR